MLNGKGASVVKYLKQLRNGQLKQFGDVDRLRPAKPSQGQLCTPAMEVEPSS